MSASSCTPTPSYAKTETRERESKGNLLLRSIAIPHWPLTVTSTRLSLTPEYCDTSSSTKQNLKLLCDSGGENQFVPGRSATKGMQSMKASFRRLNYISYKSCADNRSVSGGQASSTLFNKLVRLCLVNCRHTSL